MKASITGRKYPKMSSFHASSHQDLLDVLPRNILTVPRLMEGRTKEHTESWVACHFLAAVSRSNLLEYPFGVEHRDKPDLVLSSRSGRTGIEITRAVPINEARWRALYISFLQL